VDLRRKLGHRLGFCGNMDVQLWAKGGGFIFQSDHSVPTDVPAASYDYVVNLVRQYGVYPLKLDEFDLPELG